MVNKYRIIKDALRRLKTSSENVPTDPELWEDVQAITKGEKAYFMHDGKRIEGPNDGEGFKKFPSAYANGWAAKKYDELGGGWKKKKDKKASFNKEAIISIYNARPQPKDHGDWTLEGEHGLLSSLTGYEWALVNDMHRSEEKIQVKGKSEKKKYYFRNYALAEGAVTELQGADYLGEEEDGEIDISWQLKAKLRLYDPDRDDPAVISKYEMKEKVASHYLFKKNESDTYLYTYQIQKEAKQEYTLEPLPYDYDALEPWISTQTVKLHHDKHQKAYVDNLNKAEQKLKEARQEGDLEYVSYWTSNHAFNWGGAYLHEIYWQAISGSTPVPEQLSSFIKRDFGSFENLKGQMKAAMKGIQGSGWVVLVLHKSKGGDRLQVCQVQNHDHKALWGSVVLCPIDMWEHSYYVDYLNDKESHFDAVFDNLINWEFVASRLENNNSKTAKGRGKAKKDVGHGGLDEWFSGHGGAKGEGEDATWGDWVSISPIKKTLKKEDVKDKKIEPGDIVGPCGISNKKEWKDFTNNGKDPLKCMPRQKAYDMSKKERAELAKKKRKEEKKDKGEGKKPTRTETFKEKKARQDHTLYLTAEQIYDRMIEALERRPDLLVKGEDLPGAQEEGAMFLQGIHFGYPDLIFIFNPNKPDTNHSKKGHLHVIRLGNRAISWKARGYEGLLKELKARKRLVIHELTHYVDAHRLGEGYDSALKSYPENANEDIDGYINHPLELNAQFIESLSQISDRIEEYKAQINPRDLESRSSQRGIQSLRIWYNRYGKDFRALEKVFWRDMRTGLEWKLSEKNRKRYTKRLYNWWVKKTSNIRQILDALNR